MAKKYSYTVEKEFRNQDDFYKIHEVGEYVSRLSTEKLERLIALGMVKKIEIDDKKVNDK